MCILIYFEQDLRSRLSSTKRPLIITEWIGKRQYTKPRGVTSQYIKDWYAWYKELQPQGRCIGDRSSTAHEWKQLKRGGPLGFFLILVSLTFWPSARAGNVALSNSHKRALDDVAWVLTTMLNDMQHQRRSSNEESAQRSSKRIRT